MINLTYFFGTLSHMYLTEYYTKKSSVVKNERDRGGEGEGRNVWKLIGHLTGAVDSGVHRAKR